MMLGALYDLARREGLLADPDYETRPVHFLLRVDDKGKLVALVPTADESGRAKEVSVPRAWKRTVKVTPGFLVDNAKYVLGIGAEGKRDSRTGECAEAFREVLDRLAAETDDAGAVAAAKFMARLSDELPRIFKERPKPEWTGSEVIAFVRDADGKKLVHERAKVRSYWEKLRRQDPGGEKVRCLVTGELAAPAPTHDSVKRVPAAQSSGAALVSFNSPAFESQGLTQGENAPVSRAAAEGYVTALNWLLDRTESRRFRYGVSIGEDSVCVFWTRTKNNTPDLLASYFDPSADEGVRLADAPLRGLEPAKTDDTAFYAATLGGNAARVVLRDWLESTVADVKRNVRRYFEDLRLATGPAKPVPIWALLKSAEGPGGKGLSPELGARLFGSALRGGPFPRELLGAALRRLRLPPDKKDEPRLLHHRCALIKAVLVRLPRSGTGRQEVTVSLDEKTTAVPYLLGRLFAVLERLQGAALGDVNATIRDRYFGAASSTPALVFPRLLKLSVHHAAKAERSGWLEKAKGQIVASLPAEPFPRVMSLEDQGLFAIGYYHQRESFFEKRPVAERPESSN